MIDVRATSKRIVRGNETRANQIHEWHKSRIDRSETIDVNAGVSSNVGTKLNPSLYKWNYGKCVQSVENVFNRFIIELNLQRAFGVQFHTSRILFVIHYSLNAPSSIEKYYDQNEKDIANFHTNGNVVTPCIFLFLAIYSKIIFYILGFFGKDGNKIPKIKC